MHICNNMYICNNVCNKCMNGWTDGWMYGYMHPCMHVRSYGCLYVSLSVCTVCMHACMYVYLSVYLCIYVSIHPSVYLSNCIYVSMYLCIYASMYLCIYVYDWMWGDGVRATVWSGKHGEWLQNNPLLGVSPRFLISSYREPIPIETQFWHLVRSAAPSGKRPFGQPGSKIEIYPVLIAIFFNNMSLGKW